MILPQSILDLSRNLDSTKVNETKNLIKMLLLLHEHMSGNPVHFLRSNERKQLRDYLYNELYKKLGYRSEVLNSTQTTDMLGYTIHSVLEQTGLYKLLDLLNPP